MLYAGDKMDFCVARLTGFLHARIDFYRTQYARQFVEVVDCEIRFLLATFNHAAITVVPPEPHTFHPSSICP